MTLIVPNATDTTSGNKYTVLDQAEPDALDFEILGSGSSGVINGCEVSPSVGALATTVAVGSGVVVLNGTAYTVSASPNLALPTIPSDPTWKRFDAVVARLVGSSMVLTTIYGSSSTTNPTSPRSSARLTGALNTYDQYSYVNFDTDVVLAVVYRDNSISSMLSGHIVDKRHSVKTQIVYRSGSAPSTSTGSVGDLHLRTSALAAGESGVYVKRDSSTWQQLAGVPVDPGVPVGTVITWVSTNAPNALVWKECDGSTISRTGFSALFTVLGTQYGAGDGSTTFNLPDLRGYYLAGMPVSGGAFNTPSGNTSNTIQLIQSNIPAHTHTIDHGHSGTAQDGGIHNHRATSTQDFATRLPSAPDISYVAPQSTKSLNEGLADQYTYSSTPPYGMLMSYTSETVNSTSHQHSVTIPGSSGLVSGPSGSNPAVPVNIQPKTLYVKYYIRCA